MEIRWYTRTQQREDFTDKEWRSLCQHYMDPEPPLLPVTVLQYRGESGIWRDVEEVSHPAAKSEGEKK